VVHDDDAAARARTLARLAQWCGRYSPWTAVDSGRDDHGSPVAEDATGGAGLWLDITGCAHLFGGERRLLEDLAGRIEGFGFAATAAAAETPGAAWAVARFSGRKAEIVPDGGLTSALAGLSVVGLRLPPETVFSLHRLGLRSIGNLCALPRGPLSRRLGEAVLRRLDQALGRLDEPLSPHRPQPAFVARLALAEPVGRRQDVEAALAHLLAELRARLEAAHRGARRVEFVCYRTDGTTSRLAVGTSRPTTEPAHLARLFGETLGRLDPGFGIEVMTLAALVVEPLAPSQPVLTAGASRAAGRPPGRATGTTGDLARLIDGLSARIGADRVVWPTLLPSHVPERACREIPAFGNPAPSDGGGGCVDPAADEHRPRQPRPLELLPWPEPIEVIAPIPDGPPVWFRWRRLRRRVRTAAGPERIAPEWWLEPGWELKPEWELKDGDGAPGQPERIRDYYRIEDCTGGRFWIYREGLYRRDPPPRWYLHGLFA
jgi:protein ImuB